MNKTYKWGGILADTTLADTAISERAGAMNPDPESKKGKGDKK